MYTAIIITYFYYYLHIMEKRKRLVENGCSSWKGVYSTRNIIAII